MGAGAWEWVGVGGPRMACTLGLAAAVAGLRRRLVCSGGCAAPHWDRVLSWPARASGVTRCPHTVSPPCPLPPMPSTQATGAAAICTTAINMTWSSRGAHACGWW